MTRRVTSGVWGSCSTPCWRGKADPWVSALGGDVAHEVGRQVSRAVPLGPVGAYPHSTGVGKPATSSAPLSTEERARGFSRVSSLKAAPGQGAGPRSSGHPHRAPGHGATPSPRPPTPGHPLLRTSLLSQEAAVEACRSNGSLKDAAASDGAVTGPRAGTFTCCRGRRVASAALAPPLGALLPAEHLRLWTSLPSLWTKV